MITETDFKIQTCDFWDDARIGYTASHVLKMARGIAETNGIDPYDLFYAIAETAQVCIKLNNHFKAVDAEND